MSDGYQPNPAPNQNPVPPTTDQLIGDATSVLGNFMKDPVGAVRTAWDHKKIVMALIVAAGFVIVQLLNSIITGAGNLKFGTILGSWIRLSITQIALFAIVALIGILLVRGHCTSGYVGALSGVGAAAVPFLVGFAASTVLSLVERILPFKIIIWILSTVQSAIGTPLLIAMFVLLALAIRRKTVNENDYMVARNCVVLAGVYYAANYLIWLIL